MVFGVFCFCCFFFFWKVWKGEAPHPMAIWNPLCFSPAPPPWPPSSRPLPPEPPSLLPLPTLCVWALHSGSCNIPVFELSPPLAPSTRPPGSLSLAPAVPTSCLQPHFCMRIWCLECFLTLGAGFLALSSSVWSNEEGKENLHQKLVLCSKLSFVFLFVFVYLFWSVCARPAAAEISFAFN